MLCKSLTENSQDNFLFVFFNGFGSDYKYWNELLPYFSNCGYVLLSENYFNNPEDYDEKYLRKIFEGKRLVGVGHSQIVSSQKTCYTESKEVVDVGSKWKTKAYTGTTYQMNFGRNWSHCC